MISGNIVYCFFGLDFKRAGKTQETIDMLYIHVIYVLF